LNKRKSGRSEKKTDFWGNKYTQHFDAKATKADGASERKASGEINTPSTLTGQVTRLGEARQKKPFSVISTSNTTTKQVKKVAGVKERKPFGVRTIDSITTKTTRKLDGVKKRKVFGATSTGNTTMNERETHRKAPLVVVLPIIKVHRDVRILRGPTCLFPPALVIKTHQASPGAYRK
jgi:hypothetical protein